MNRAFSGHDHLPLRSCRTDSDRSAGLQPLSRDGTTNRAYPGGWFQVTGGLLRSRTESPWRALQRGLSLSSLLLLQLLPAPRADAQPTSSPTASEAAAVAAAVRQLPDIVREAMDRTGVHGVAVAVVHRDRLLYADGFGVRDVQQGGAVNADTVFQLASISKPLGATVVAALISRGRISWDTPAATLLPGFALADAWVSRQVTIGDLYAHRSGLPGDFGNDLNALGLDRQTILERARYVPLAPFRLTYAYNNWGLTAGATAAANAAGMGWAELTRELLFEPLGMTRTTFSEQQFRRMDNSAVLHQKQNGRWMRGPFRHTDGLAPAGGASSSVNDMAR